MYGLVTRAVAALPHSLALSDGIAHRHARPLPSDRAASARDVGRLAELALASARTGDSFVLLIPHPETGRAAWSIDRRCMPEDGERVLCAGARLGGS